MAEPAHPEAKAGKFGFEAGDIGFHRLSIFFLLWESNSTALAVPNVNPETPSAAWPLR